MNTQWEKHLDAFVYYLKLERSFSPNTVESYLYDCRRLVDFLSQRYPDLKEQEVDIKVLNEFVSSLERKKLDDDDDIVLSAATQQRIIQGVRAFFKFLFFSDVIESNPSEQLITPYSEYRLPDILSYEEIKRMTEVIDVSKLHNYRNRLIIKMLYATGMRVSELVNLKKSDINRKEEYLDIIGKGNKERLIPLDSKVMEDLLFYIDRYRALIRPRLKDKPNNYVFRSQKQGDKLTRQFVFEMIKEAALAAGINKKVHPHILRHSFATEMIRAGANLMVVKEIMGHSSIASTEIYINLNTSDLRDTLEKYHPFYTKKH
ncbi:MAG: tyrosine-type recombinase/integrase [Bacteroidales bacterium]|nr:tyrosine-type recombinase/integrase [Bacteroidales bacterium]